MKVLRAAWAATVMLAIVAGVMATTLILIILAGRLLTWAGLPSWLASAILIGGLVWLAAFIGHLGREA